MIATDANPAIPTPQQGDPVWDLARLFPAQGNWTEEEYLALQTGGMVELSDGNLEVLPAATMFHQLISSGCSTNMCEQKNSDTFSSLRCPCA